MYILTVFLMLLSLSNGCMAQDREDYGFLTNEIVGNYSQDLKRYTGLRVRGYGGSMASEVKKVIIRYLGDQELDVPEARRLFIYVMNGLLANFNASTEIRPYLRDYPFTWKNIDMNLAFEDENDVVSNGKIAFVFIAQGNILYERYDKDTRSYTTVYQEPYEEAIRIVREEQKQLGGNG